MTATSSEARYPAQRFFPSMLEFLSEPGQPDRQLSDREQAEQQYRANETRRLVESQTEPKQ